MTIHETKETRPTAITPQPTKETVAAEMRTPTTKETRPTENHMQSSDHTATSKPSIPKRLISTMKNSSVTEGFNTNRTGNSTCNTEDPSCSGAYVNHNAFSLVIFCVLFLAFWKEAI